MMTMEYDLLIMSLCIFVPSVFALGLLFFPKGTEEYMRWWALVGTAITFVLSAIVFIDYWQMLQQHPSVTKSGILRAEPRRTSLVGRHEVSAEADAKNNAQEDRDLHARYPWI